MAEPVGMEVEEIKAAVDVDVDDGTAAMEEKARKW